MARKLTMFYAHADWLAQKWIASTIHLQAVEEKNWHNFSLIFGIGLVYTKTVIHFHFDEKLLTISSQQNHA